MKISRKSLFIVVILILSGTFVNAVVINEVNFNSDSTRALVGTVVANEVNYDPESVPQFIELYNLTSSSIDLSGWEIQAAGASFNTVVTLPEDSTIPANGYFLISAGTMLPTPDVINAGFVLDSDFSVDIAGVRLRDDSLNVIDTVLYGYSSGVTNTNGLQDDLGSVDPADATIDIVGTCTSISRSPAGTDTDVSFNDFFELVMSPTNSLGETGNPCVLATNTPTPTVSPSSTPTPSLSPTPTPTINPTTFPSPTPSPTPLPTLDCFWDITIVASNGNPEYEETYWSIYTSDTDCGTTWTYGRSVASEIIVSDKEKKVCTGWTLGIYDFYIPTIISDGTSNEFSYDMQAGSYILTWLWKTQYYLETLSDPFDGGTVMPTSDWFDDQDVVNISATPNAGWEFMYYEGDLSGTDSQQELTIDSPKQVIGKFTHPTDIENWMLY